ncbi:Maestro heat-like repeat-containing protein family member 7, partial [Antrostomus carolinensis]
AFGKYLEPSEKTDIVLVAIEAMRDSSIFDIQVTRNMLDILMKDPSVWLADVPKITECIHHNQQCISTAPARQSMESLLLLMTNRCPGEVVMTLLKITPPGDSTAMAMWEAMFSAPQTLKKIFKELLFQVPNQDNRLFVTFIENSCIYRFALLTYAGMEDEDFSAMYKAYRFLTYPSPVMLSLVLRGLMTLSEGAEMARKMRVFLPDLMGLLQDDNEELKRKALVVICNVMRHLNKKKASPIAVELAEKLLPLFDECSSHLRELSIGLFKDLMKTVVWKNKREMKNKVRMALLPLFFHMSDEMQNVAKVSREALLAAAELLNWKQLKHLVQTQQIWRIGECLLVQDRRRAEEKNLPYLKHAQVTLQEAAIRFIGLAARPLREQNREKLSEIISALIKSMDKDSELFICSLVVQTIYVLKSPRVQQRSGWTLRVLCC